MEKNVTLKIWANFVARKELKLMAQISNFTVNDPFSALFSPFQPLLALF